MPRCRSAAVRRWQGRFAPGYPAACLVVRAAAASAASAAQEDPAARSRGREQLVPKARRRRRASPGSTEDRTKGASLVLLGSCLAIGLGILQGGLLILIQFGFFL